MNKKVKNNNTQKHNLPCAETVTTTATKIRRSNDIVPHLMEHVQTKLIIRQLKQLQQK